MSQNDTQFNKAKQKEAFGFVVKEHNPFTSGSGFPLLSTSNAVIRQPHAGDALDTYKPAAEGQFAQEIYTAEKVTLAMHLEGQALIQSVAGISQTAQVGRALARSLADEELAEFVNDYLQNGIRFLTTKHAQHLEQLSGRLGAIIEAEVKPARRRGIFG